MPAVDLNPGSTVNVFRMEHTSTPPGPVVPNHHADHRGFAGPLGLVAGLTMTFGRDAVARHAVDAVALQSGDTLVDVGCGPGTAARIAARGGATVIGIDPAPVMLKLARALTRGAPVTWTEGAAESLPLADGTATVLWAIATVHHWPDVDAGLGEAHRVLAPRGRLLAIERRARPGAHGLASHGWTDAQAQAFADCCRAAGFADVVVEQATLGRRGAHLVVHGTRP
jgi:ubiquinone/menaquinone biosynthesis C-methylase UbiE